MRTIFLSILLMAIMPNISFAQQMFDDFESNQYG